MIGMKHPGVYQRDAARRWLALSASQRILGLVRSAGVSPAKRCPSRQAGFQHFRLPALAAGTAALRTRRFHSRPATRRSGVQSGCFMPDSFPVKRRICRKQQEPENTPQALR